MKLPMSVLPHGSDETKVESPAEPSAPPRRRVHDLANTAFTRTKDATASALAASRDAWGRAAELKREAGRSRVAQRIVTLADKSAVQTKHATATAVAVSKVGFAKAAKIGRETLLPELSRTGAKVKERTRPERLAKDYRDFLMWLHETVLDRAIEPLFFRPTSAGVALDGLTVCGDNRAHGHDYRPTPRLVFEWALAGVDDDFSRLSFVDYGAGKGRVLLLASQHPFAAIGGIEFAEELHDEATMNIAQFPRSRMKCRTVECVHEDAAALGPLDGEAVHYFFDPFSREVFAEVLNGLIASYRARPRRLYLILIDAVAADLVEESGVFEPAQLPLAQRIRARLFSPYKIAVYRSIA
jgi:hypothetical protein